MLGFSVIRQGERASLWKPNGRRQIIEGPKVAFTGSGKIERLDAVVAAPHEYLMVRHVDGRTEHRRGPAVEWMDPVEFEFIEVHKALAVSANESIVVYREELGSVDRRVERGPGLYVLGPNEWVHHFKWHGADPANGGRKIPGALDFLKLRVIPDQLYFDVEEVRTSDEALITVKLMVFFELVDVERMLDKTHDPVADFINALSADIICFVSGGSFEDFKEKTEALNEHGTYRQLCQRAASVGYRISKVVYRGYHANKTLQAMHDNAIEIRTRLLLESETEVQAQELEDLKQARRIERDRKQLQQEAEKAEHKRRQVKLDHAEKMRSNEAEKEMDLKYLKENQEQKLALWKTLKDLDADVTQVLVAEQRNPDKFIQVSGSDRPQMHLHEA